jgi:hypothetical protein
MNHRLVSGGELLQYLLNHGFEIGAQDWGTVIVVPRGQREEVWETWANVPYLQRRVTMGLLRQVLDRTGIDWEDFWNEVG